VRSAAHLCGFIANAPLGIMPFMGVAPIGANTRPIGAWKNMGAGAACKKPPAGIMPGKGWIIP
tara:strand:+ start:1560 stop:1748 length:189 start_codon:yes stop_codon:yes gene_type:complete